MLSTARSPVLRLSGITKRFGDLLANDGIDLELAGGEILALLGENGAGKTTLMNIIFGHYTADEGKVEAARIEGELRPLPPGNPDAALSSGIGMVHQHFTLADNLSAFENLVLGTEPLWRPWQSLRGARARAQKLMTDSGLAVDLAKPVSSLSVGERQRVEILKALYRGARILILDEPTAVLTPQETEALFATLRRLAADGLAVVFISHKLHEVLSISDRIAILRGGRIVADLPAAGTERAYLAETMVGKAIPEPVRDPQAPGAPMLQIRNVAVEAEPGRTPLRDLSLTLRAHEIIGIAGVSGNGQTAFSNLISGLARHHHGQIELFGKPLTNSNPARMVRAGVGRIPEDRHQDGVVGEMAVWETVMLEDYYRAPYQRFGLLQPGAARERAQTVIRNYEVKCPGPDAITKLLSGGNIQKLILGRVLDREPGLILANQPTRGLDIGAVTYVHQQLLAARRRGAGIILISEDLDELLTLSDRIAVLYQGHLSNPERVEEVTIRQLGLMMAGQGFEEAAHAA